MEASFTHRQVTSMADSSDVAGRDYAGTEKPEALETFPSAPDEDSFKLMMDHKRSVVKVSLFIGMPLFSVMAIKNFIRGDHFMAFSNCMMLLILILLGFVIIRKIDEKSEYKIHSILSRLFIAVMSVSLFYDIGFQSNFSRIEWCYIYPILVFFAVGVKEGTIWVSIFYGILAFLILNFDLQGITLFQIQGLRTRFLVSFFAVCILSLFLEQGFRRIQQRLLHHQRILKESENRYRQAYEQLNMEMQERKRAEEALLNAAQQWRTTFDGISDIVCLLDLEGRILRCNKAMVNLFGKPFSEIIGRPHWEIIHGTTGPIKESPFEPMRETRRKEIAILPIGDRWFNIAVDPLLDEAGNLFGAVHIMSDITEQKQAEEALRESEERYRIILEDIEDGYFEVDIAGNLTSFNDSSCQMLGYTKDELMGRNNRQYMDKETAKKVYQVFNQVYTTGKPCKAFDWEIIRKDGTKRFHNSSVSLIRDSEGERIGFRGIIRDITERKQAEEALRRSEEEAKRLSQENAIMAEIGRIISSTLNIEEVYDRFAEEVRKLIPFDRIALSTFNPESHSSTMAYVLGVEVEDRDQGAVLSLTSSFYEEMIAKRSGILIQTEDESELAERYPTLLSTFRAGIRSILSAPLISKDQVIGVLHFRSLKPNAYTETDLRLAEKVGNQIAGAIANAQLFIERKRATEALRQSEEKYRTILENIQDGYFEDDLAGNLTFFNDSVCGYLGYTREELTGMNYRQYTDETTARKLYQTYNGVYRTGEPIKALEAKYIRKDGTKGVYEQSVSLIRNSEGKPIGFRGVTRDVTERKRAEETLRESEDCYRDLVEFSQHLICTHDLRGEIFSVNQEGARLLGYDQRDLLNKNIRNLLVPEFRDEFDTYLDTIQKHGVAKGLMLLQTATGEKRIWEYNNTLRTEGVTVPIVRAIAHDVTERIRTEKAVTRLSQENAIVAEIGRIISSTLNIEEVYERFAEEVRKLIPFDRIVINVIDTEKSAVSNVYMAGKGIADRKVKEIYSLEGSGNAEMVRTKSSILIQTEDFNEYKDRFPMLLSTFQAGFRSIMNVPLFSKGQVIGGLLLRSFKPYAYTDKDVRLAERVSSQIAGAIANAQLFIERKRAEEERTALQEQLRQSQKMEAIGKLAGGIAHDFNNLLTVITGYSDMILRRLNQNDSMRGNAEEIQRAAEKAASLTRQLLAFSRKQMLQSKVLDLNNLVTNMDKMFQRLIGENIDLITLSAKDLGRIKADPGQIEQVLLNLVVNAKDAMPSGGKLTIEMANVELDENYAHSHINVKPGCYVMLSVSDTGCGMPPEIREKIFEPFFTTKEKGKGTGLGLSTVYGIVKQSEGSIYVYSEPGRGTAFKIYFPRIEEVIESIEPGAKITKSFQGSETILLVEDEEMLRRLARTILQDNGYNVLEASNGEEALRIAQEHGAKQIHLMLTDVVMPRMSGRELADCLEPVRPEMKVLYISGYADDAIIRHGVLEQGMAFVQKPFTPDALVRKVRNVLDKSQQEQQSFSEISKEGVIQKDGLQTSEKHERNSGQTDRRLLS